MCSNLICVDDFEKLAATKLSEIAYGYFSDGAGPNQQTVHENREAFKRWRFRPRALRDVSTVDLSTTVQGSKIPFPVCMSPTASGGLAHETAEIASATAAKSLDTIFTLSMRASNSMEEISKPNPDSRRWCQLQYLKDERMMKHFIKRAESCGFQAFVLTVDKSITGMNWQTEIFKMNIRLGNLQYSVEHFHPDIAKMESMKTMKSMYAFVHGYITWEKYDWIKSQTRLPVILKGILTAEMALEAVEHGVDGIVVSNHGGRQLDGVSATIDALPEVMKAVNGRCEVYMDGGIRSGNDVAKAIALGAKAVFIGRPAIWGLACDGEKGVRKVLEILRDEFEIAMKLLGVKSIEELQTTPNLVVHEREMMKF